MRAWIGYGGTFDPIHCGHLAVAHAVTSLLGAHVHLVVAADPPHKGATHVDAMYRLRMVELATAGDRDLHVDRRELLRKGPSYSVETLLDVRREVGESLPVIWVVGADSLAQLHRWHRWRELFDIAHVLAAGRPGFSLDPAGLAGIDAALADAVAERLCAPHALLDAPHGGLALLPMQPPRSESSTEIRRRIASNEPWHVQVPPSVAAYIARHRLYARADPA